MRLANLKKITIATLFSIAGICILWELLPNSSKIVMEDPDNLICPTVTLMPTVTRNSKDMAEITLLKAADQQIDVPDIANGLIVGHKPEILKWHDGKLSDPGRIEYEMQDNMVVLDDFNQDGNPDIAVVVREHASNANDGGQDNVFIFSKTPAGFRFVASTEENNTPMERIESLKYIQNTNPSGDGVAGNGYFIVKERNHGPNYEDFGYCPTHTRTIKFSIDPSTFDENYKSVIKFGGIEPISSTDDMLEVR